MTKGLLLAACFVLASAAHGAPLQRWEEARPVMGTMARVSIWAGSVAEAQAGADTAFAFFVRVDSLMSTWNGNSPLSRLNRAPIGQWVSVGPEVCEVVAAALDVAALSGGAFDPTVLPLVRLWGFRGGVAAVPDSAQLLVTLAGVGFGAVEIAGERARLNLAEAAVDLGGIAKGYALDGAAQALVHLGIAGGSLDLGGNLLVFGDGPGREVGIIDPLVSGSLAFTLPLVHPAVATSGQYERFVTVDGQSYGHILDPRTGWPVAGGVSVTVLSSQALWADALATAALVLGMEKGLDLLEMLPGVEGVIIDGNDVRATSGLPLETLSE